MKISKRDINVQGILESLDNGLKPIISSLETTKLSKDGKAKIIEKLVELEALALKLKEDLQKE